MGAWWSTTGIALARTLRPDDEQQLIKRQFKRKPALYLGSKRQKAYEAMRALTVGQAPGEASGIRGPEHGTSGIGGGGGGGAEAAFSPEGFWVDIGVSCTGLPRADLFSMSDPMAVLYERIEGTVAWRERGRTEMMLNNEGGMGEVCVVLPRALDGRVVFAFPAHPPPRIILPLLEVHPSV